MARVAQIQTEPQSAASSAERVGLVAFGSQAIDRIEARHPARSAKDAALAILADIPGVKGLWINTKRIQPSDFSRTFVIEFADRDSYDAYVKHPKKKAWDKHYYSIREQSFNCITVN